jgi:hypothetical protein
MTKLYLKLLFICLGCGLKKEDMLGALREVMKTIEAGEVEISE